MWNAPQITDPEINQERATHPQTATFFHPVQLANVSVKRFLPRDSDIKEHELLLLQKTTPELYSWEEKKSNSLKGSSSFLVQSWSL